MVRCHVMPPLDIDETVFSLWAIEQQTGRKWNIQPFAVRIIHTDLFSWYTLKVYAPLDKQELTARSFLVHRASVRNLAAGKCDWHLLAVSVNPKGDSRPETLLVC